MVATHYGHWRWRLSGESEHSLWSNLKHVQVKYNKQQNHSNTFSPLLYRLQPTLTTPLLPLNRRPQMEPPEVVMQHHCRRECGLPPTTLLWPPRVTWHNCYKTSISTQTVFVWRGWRTTGGIMWGHLWRLRDPNLDGCVLSVLQQHCLRYILLRQEQAITIEARTRKQHKSTAQVNKVCNPNKQEVTPDIRWELMHKEEARKV